MTLFDGYVPAIRIRSISLIQIYYTILCKIVRLPISHQDEDGTKYGSALNILIAFVIALSFNEPTCQTDALEAVPCESCRFDNGLTSGE